MTGDIARLESLPGNRLCTRCATPVRPSHSAYAGAGRSVPVYRCPGCGMLYRGAERDASEVDERRAREARDRRDRRHAGPGAGAPRWGSKPGRRPLDEGAPENPVLDEETARQLRDLLGG